MVINPFWESDLFLQPERLHEHHIHINALVTLIRTDTTSYLYWDIRMLPRGVIYLHPAFISHDPFGYGYNIFCF